MTDDARDNAVDVKALSSVRPGTLMEISDVSDVRDSEYGKYHIATYAATLTDGTRTTGRVRLPEHIVKGSPEPPFLALYDGLKDSKNGKTYNDVSVMKPTVQGLMSPAKLQKYADDLRAKGEQAVFMKMRIQTLEAFAAGTLFVYSDVERRKARSGMEEVVVVAFETEMEGECVTGRMYVPSRCVDDMLKNDSGVLLYRGKRDSTRTPGRSYYDVSVVDERVLSNL